MIDLELTVNGEPARVRVEPGARLLDVLRGPLGLPGTKEGCGNGECGACTVVVAGRPVCACLTPAAEVEGLEVLTVEGLVGPGGDLSAVQRAFVAGGGVQCGFCTPGMVMSVHALLERNPDPTPEDVREALTGNLCRCTGYAQIVESALLAARERREARERGDRA